ncbi:hypothetical protein QTG54_001760 [Skeletonema marinoi]|uniref:BTB domain-containing protein n=2 Tax=Skeletonema marinoi TaxID=267567 RepID=A0AAD8YKH2_9STRA|nr:hypothetical protein QTG54_001760 [Skeletonema marinoi]
MSSPGPSKKIRSQPPDVIVAVGSGESMQEFHCYRVILSFASDYFDTMLSASMIENETGRIEFTNKDPLMWKKFYSFIDPDKLSVAETHATIDVTTAITFVPWFHEFQMTSFLKKCDVVLAERVEKIRAYEHEFLSFNDCDVDNGGLQEVIELLKLSCTYDLDKSKDKTEEYICSLLETIQNTSDLFDVHRIKSLHSLFAPVDIEQCTVFYEDGEEEIVKEIIPAGKSKRICNAFLNMLVSSDKPEFIYDLVSHLSLETINNAEVFPLLLHSYVLRAASVATTLSYKRKLADRDESLGAAKCVINDLLLKTPGTSEQYNELFQSIEGQIDTQTSQGWECLFQKGVLTPTRVKQQCRENMRRLNHATSVSGWRSPTVDDWRVRSRNQRSV